MTRTPQPIPAVSYGELVPPALRAEIEGLTDVREQAERALVRALAVFDQRADYAADAALSAVAWLKAHTPLWGRDAAELVKIARLVQTSNRLDELLATGQLTMRKARILARYAIPARRKIWLRDADLLLTLAVRLRDDDLERAMAHWAKLADDELERGEPRNVHENRRVVTHYFEDRGELHAYGPAADIATIEKLLERNQPPDPTDGEMPPRSRGQRLYDAFIELLRRGSNRPDGRLDPEHTVDVLVDYETFCRALGLPTNTPASEALDTLEARRGEIGDGPVLPTATLSRLCCDSFISRLVFGPDGEILDLGRRQRLFSPAQRRAIRARDGGCVFPGCDRPGNWCDVHHVIEWDDGGHTVVVNGACMCRPHHTLVHEGGWRLWQDEHGTWHAEPN